MIYRFEEVDFEPTTRELRCGDRTVQLTKQSHGLLRILIEHRARVVSKEELCQRVWHRRVVSDEAIHTAIAALRRSIARVAGNRQCIRTVHRSGYRFVAEVVTEAPERSALSPRRALVGREVELEAICHSFSAAEHSGLVVSVLGGEAGIGKSHTALHAADRAQAADFQVLQTAGSEAGPSPALAPWVATLRRARALYGAARWDEVIAVGGLSLVDELLDDVASFAREDSIDASVDNVGLFDQLTRLLCALTELRPLFLLLDDLHRFDAPSLRLLAHLIRFGARARIAIVATLRNEPNPGPDAQHALLQRIVREAPVASGGCSFELRPLAEPEIEALIRTEASRPPLPGEVHALFERSEGNPFYAIELFQHGQGRAMSRGVAQKVVDVPSTLRDLIAARLQALPRDTVETLGAASVFGRHFDPIAVSGVIGASPTRVQDDLVAAQDARLIDGPANGLEERSFAHILIRDVLYGSLSAEPRARFHLAAATAIEARSGRASTDDRVEIARHRALAAPHGDLAHAVACCLEAARMLRHGRLAFEEALVQLRHAERLLDLARRGADDERREVRLQRAEVEHLAGHSDASVRSYTTLMEDARERGDALLLGRATLGLFAPFYLGKHTKQWDSDRRKWLGLARDAIDGLSREAHPALVAQLESRLSVQLLREHRIPEAVCLSNGCRQIARDLGDPALRAETLIDGHAEMITTGRYAEALAFAEEGLEIADSLGVPALVHRFRLHLLDHALAVGDDARLRERADRVVDRSQSLGSYESRRATITWALFEGRLAFARESLDDLLAALQVTHGAPGANVPLLIQQMRIQQLVGGSRATLRAYEPHARRDPANLLVRAHLADALTEVGRGSEARQIVEDLAGRTSDVLARRDWAILLASLARAAARTGTHPGLGPLREALVSHRSGFVLWPGGTLCCAPFALVTAQLAQAIGDRASADADFASAIELSERMGARPFVVEARSAFGAALQARDTRSRRGADLTLAAQREARQLGMLPPGAEASSG